MPFEWDEETMGTGVPEIDAQHQELIKRLRGLLAAMRAGRSESELGSVLDFLGEYAAWHFGQEEACMDRHHCRAAAANRSAHRHFVAVFEELAARVKAEGPKMSLTIRAERELADWVRHHIVRIDSQLKECVLRKSVPGTRLEGPAQLGGALPA